MSVTGKPESNKVKYQYKIDNDLVPLVDRDSGVIIKLSSIEHINEEMWRAYWML